MSKRRARVVNVTLHVDAMPKSITVSVKLESGAKRVYRNLSSDRAQELMVRWMARLEAGLTRATGRA